MEHVSSADGTPVAYERTGSGPPLVLVHGSAADHGRWELFGVREALAERFTVYAMDRRGRGESGDAEEYDLEREFEDVTAVVESLDGPAVLLGHSFGALCSLEAALRIDGLRGLVLYEPPIVVAGLLEDLDAEGVLSELSSLVDAGENERALVCFLERVAELAPSEIDAMRAAPNWQDRVDAAHTLYRETVAPGDYVFDQERFAEMTTPTLLLSGDRSPTHERASTAAVDDALPDARLVVFEGHGHVAMNTAPERFVEEVVAFAGEWA